MRTIDPMRDWLTPPGIVYDTSVTAEDLDSMARAAGGCSSPAVRRTSGWTDGDVNYDLIIPLSTHQQLEAVSRTLRREVNR